MRQETLTVVARVDGASALAPLRAELKRLASDCLPGGGARPRLFAAPALGIHFARLVLLEEPEGSEFSSSLVFESNFDTSLEDPDEARDAHVELLADTIGSELRAVFQHCQGFGPDLAESLAEHSYPSSACYQGHTHRDLSRIRLEQHLREVLIDFFSRAPKAPPRELYHAAREYVRLRTANDPLLAGLDLDAPSPPTPDAALRTRRLNAGLMAWVMNISSDLWAFVFIHLRDILRWPRRDQQYDQRARQEAWRERERQVFVEIAETEDYALQNALTHLVPLRGADRLSVLLHSHGYIDVMARNHFNDIGQLGGIPTIHFAKWLLVDDQRRLLFLSNYDSSWESYLGDFVDRAAIGLNLAWTCTADYPKTKLLVLGGAADEERFKAWSRAHQRPTQLFYTAYPELGIAALNNNTWIRCGLHHPPGGVDLRGWFRRLT